MTRLVIAIAIIVVVAVVAQVVQRRRRPDAPTQRNYSVPEQLDRTDFPRPDAPWLVVVFTSDVCDMCASVWSKAQVLEADEVAVAQAEFIADRAIHERYRIDAVPTTVIADARGVTQHSFLGPVSASDLWAAVAAVRDTPSDPTA